MKTKVFLLIRTFLPNDAVGNDVLGMREILRQAGYDARIFAENIHPAHASVAAVADPGMAEWQDRDAILIYHHAIDWPGGEEILARSRNRIVVKYHNVTPPEFYARYSAESYGWCVRGREATRRLAEGRIDAVWGDSTYNAGEFIDLGVDRARCRVVPPVHRIEDLGRAPLDTVVTGECRAHTVNILFVGAFRPHKGHAKALEVFREYRRLSGREARLLFVGNFDPALEQYVREVEESARRLEVADGVSFHHSATVRQLRSYYTAASVFLCVSEHEGFCVPLAEAMYFRAPIVAWATTAVGETCGGCGIVLDRFDAPALASGIEECVEDPVTSRRLGTLGRRRYEEAFHPDAIAGRLLALVCEVETSVRQ